MSKLRDAAAAVIQAWDRSDIEDYSGRGDDAIESLRAALSAPDPMPVVEAAVAELRVVEGITPKLHLTQHEDERLMDARMKLHAAVRAYESDDPEPDPRPAHRAAVAMACAYSKSDARDRVVEAAVALRDLRNLWGDKIAPEDMDRFRAQMEVQVKSVCAAVRAYESEGGES